MGDRIERLLAFLRHLLWGRHGARLGPLHRAALHLARLAYGLTRVFQEGQLTLWAMSLVYTTLLSLVPLLAVSFSVLKAFGVRDTLRDVVMDFLAPLGPQGAEVGERILSFVGNMQVGVLGSVGMAVLFYTVVSLVSKVETSFNLIWHVSSNRSLARRFSDYLSVLVIGPVLLFSAVAVTGAAMSSTVVQRLSAIEPLGTFMLVTGRLLPYLLVCAAFAFLYGFIPNTRVRPTAALAGGLFAGILWYSVGWAFTAFLVNASNYSAIYSGFAGAVLFIIWLYLAWLILLMGSQVAFFWQCPRFLDPRHEITAASNRQREAYALAVMALVAGAHHRGDAPYTAASLATRLDLRGDIAQALLDILVTGRLLTPTSGTPPAYLPARDIARVSLKEVVDAASGLPPTQLASLGLNGVATVMTRVDGALNEALGEETLLSLVADTESGAPI